MSMLTQMPVFVPSSAYYADNHSEYDELERPTLSFRQLRVALPHFLFEELFESGKKAKTKAQQPAVPAPATTASPVHQAWMPPKEAVQAARARPHQPAQQPPKRVQAQQPLATSPSPVARSPVHHSRSRTDSESSSSSVDSMKLAGALAATTSAKGTRRSPSPSSPTPLRNAESASEQLLMRCIRELPAELRDCFTEWRRERKEAILAHDVHRQRAVERVMWGALHNIKASSFQQ